MADRKFSKEFEVHYYEIDSRQMATPIAILNYLEETAVAHSESVGLGIVKLKSEGVGWVLNRWQLRMERYPLWGQKVRVKTWPSSFERFYATREFLLTDEQGGALGRASSLWVYLNIIKKRPMRIPTQYSTPYGLDRIQAVAEPYQEVELENPDDCLEFRIRKSDIDTNNHVNNAKYVEWALEAIPPALSENGILASLDIAYKKEASYGSGVRSACKLSREEHVMKEYAHQIVDIENGIELARAKTTWTSLT